MEIKDPMIKKHEEYLLHTYAPEIERHANSLKSQGMIPSHIDNEDLHDAGRRGLYEAVSKWKNTPAAKKATTEAEKVAAFHSYAAQRIKNTMLDHAIGNSVLQRQKSKFSGTYVPGQEPQEPAPTYQVSVPPSASPKSK